jgi:predicted regulator of Ras-like GTPase activity (Roadblock/LC7/MglB family)
MDAAEALAELTELSSQIERAVVLRADGSVLASVPEDDASAQALATASLELLAAAFELRSAPQEVSRVEIELAEGALFVLHEDGRTIAATSGPEPTSGLVVYDLRTCLHRISAPEKPKSRRGTKAASAEEPA